MEERHLTDEEIELLLAGVVLPDVQRHIQHCDTCRTRWEAEERAHVRLHQVTWVAAPAGFHERVMQRVAPTPTSHAETLGSVRLPALLAFLGAVGMTMMFAVGAWGAYRWGGPWFRAGWAYLTAGKNILLALWGALLGVLRIVVSLSMRLWALEAFLIGGIALILLFLILLSVSRRWWGMPGMASG